MNDPKNSTSDRYLYAFLAIAAGVLAIALFLFISNARQLHQRGDLHFPRNHTGPMVNKTQDSTPIHSPLP